MSTELPKFVVNVSFPDRQIAVPVLPSDTIQKLKECTKERYMTVTGKANVEIVNLLNQQQSILVGTDKVIDVCDNHERLIAVLPDNTSDFETKRKDELRALDVQHQVSESMIAQDSHFQAAVISNKIIVDKSLVIETLIRTEKALVTFPRRWGKSFNLSTVKAFLEVELDNFGKPLPEDLCINRKLFQKGAFDQSGRRVPMKIMNNVDLVNQHFGKYIVLKLDFQNISGRFDQIFRDLSTSISELYQQFAYLKLVAKQVHLSTIEKGMECEHAPMTPESISFLKSSLKKLASLLHTYYNRDIVILVDEYDCPINNIFQTIHDKNERDQALSLFKDLLGNAIKGQPHVRFVMLTGILRLGKSASLAPLNNLQEYTLTQPEFARYYGFTHEEVNQLFQILRFDNDYLQLVQRMYNGYRFNSTDSVYNPWSLASCLNSAIRNRIERRSFGHNNSTIRSYWTESGNIRYVVPLLLHSLVLQKLGQLLNPSKRTTKFKLIDPICTLEMDVLGELLSKHQLNQPFEMNEYQVNILFSYLCYQGYFSIDNINDSNECTISLPNLEVKMEINKLVNYALKGVPNLTSTFILQKVIQEFVEGYTQGHVLERFGQNLQTSFQNFILQLSALFQPQPPNEPYLHGTEDIIHCLLASIIADKFSDIGLTSWFGSINGRGRCDIFFTHQDLAVVMELKYEGTAYNALQQIHDKGYYESLALDHARLCLIGLNVNSNKQVTVAIEFYDRNSETPLTYPAN